MQKQTNYHPNNIPYEQQSQVINRRFRQLMKLKDSHSQSEINYVQKFTQEQRQDIKKRFNQLCKIDKMMNYQQFRRGLGLLGREDSFICRIFNLIDHDHDGYITEDNYIQYLSVILKGNDLQKSRFGWRILTEDKGDIEFKQFLQLFQEISVVWNALTGQIITPQRKYIEQLFNTFDVDQDQSITFQEQIVIIFSYRIFFNQKLLLSGWFEYFNSIDIDQEYSRVELEKVREKLRNKLLLEPRDYQNEGSMQGLRHRIHDIQLTVQKKVFNLSKNMQEDSNMIRKRYNDLQQKTKSTKVISAEKSTQTVSIYTMSSKTLKSMKTIKTTDEDNHSIKSLYKYNFAQSLTSNPINKLHFRKQKMKNQNKIALNQQVIQELQSLLQSTYKIMNICHSYHDLKQKQKKNSPTKLKQMQIKLNLFDKQQDKNEKDIEGKNKKMIVYFGHQNWNLVLNIMVGLRKSIKALYELNLYLEIKDNHFKEEHSFFLGNKGYLSGKGPQAFKNMQKFQFIQIGPMIFERLRKLYGITNNDYQRSVGPESLLNQLLTGDLTALNQKCSTGKSSSFFYLTNDNKVFLKTIPKDEFLFFIDILKNYYEHMINHSNSLIVRIYGLYKLKIYVNKQKINTIYFISMENIFKQVSKENQLQILQVYDLKGSLYNRLGEQGKQLKDQDWVDKNKKIRLYEKDREIFRQQIKLDSKFFKKNNINDYSLMVAFVKYQGPLQRRNGNIFKSFKGGIISKQNGILMILTIIDILTAFQTRKNLQYLFKTTFLSKNVSCIPPSDYCTRFRQFIYKSIQ